MTLASLLTTEHIWVAVGLLGQAIFAGRFLLQWIYSERQKQSVIPVGFWYMSLLGSLILLVYALYRRDPVFIIGQAFGFIVYIRNLQLIAKHKATSH